MRRILGWLLALGVLGVIGLVAAELVLRALPTLMPEAAQLRVHWQVLGQESPSLGDPELGFVYPPHHEGELRYGDFGFTYTTDEHGFRNPSPWPARADVVVLGDSQAFGYGVELDRSWWQLVADGLPDSEVVNLGLIGAAPQQYARVFERFGAELHPEVVLLALFPAYALTAANQFDTWLAEGSPGNYDRWRRGASRSDWRSRLKRLLEKTYLYFALRTVLGEWRGGESSSTMTLADGGEIMLAPVVYRQASGWAQPDNPNFERVMAIIEGVRADARADGGELVVVLIPTKEEVHLPLQGEPGAAFTASFAEALAARGIPRVDTAPALRARAEQGEQVFFTLDVHPNAAGQQLIADLVLDLLRQQGRLEVAAGPERAR